MLIVALVLAVISLAALVTAVVTSNELIAWACIGLSALGVLLLIVDAVRDRNRRPAARPASDAETTEVLAPVTAAAIADDDDDDDDDDNDVIDDDDVDEDEDEDYVDEDEDEDIVDYPSEAVEDHPDEVVYDDPDHDLPDDDEPSYPIAAEEAAIHTISAEELAAQADSDVEAESGVETYITSDDSGSYTVVYSGEPSDQLSDEVAEDSSLSVPDEPSYMVTETPTVSYADTSADDSSVIVIYSSETEERGGER